MDDSASQQLSVIENSNKTTPKNLSDYSLSHKNDFNDAENGQYELEKRNYVLNRHKSLEKKRQALDRKEVEIVETGGGVRIYLSTAVYEIFKTSVNEFFIADLNERKCKKTHVQDQLGRVVDEKYRVVSGKWHQYTLNMYHTTSSCLINGKQVGTFLEKDLHEIFNKMENVLRSRGLSLGELNNELTQLLNAIKRPETDRTEATVENKSVRMLRDQVESVRAIRRTDSNKKDDESAITGVQIDYNTQSELKSIDTKTDNERFVETVDVQCQTFSTESPELILMRKLFNMTENLNQALHSFIQESRSEFTSLRDELQCIKNKVKFESRNAEENVSNLENSAEKIENDIQLSIHNTQKKFQSIYDLLKASTPKQLSPSAVLGKSQQPSPTTVSEQKTCNKQPPQVISDQNEQSTPRIRRTNTLIIGDSILRGIHTRGLSDLTAVKTLRGKRIRDVCVYLRAEETVDISKVVIYIGGNDVAQNSSNLQFRGRG